MKLTALFQIASCAVLIGYWKGESIRKKARLQTELLSFFQHLSFQIEVFSRAQNEIYSAFSAKLLCQVGFLDRLQEEFDQNPSGTLYRAASWLCSTQEICGEVRDLILNYCSGFGMRSRERELQEAQMLLKALSPIIEKESNMAEHSIRLARLVGFTVGMGIIIILW